LILQKPLTAIPKKPAIDPFQLEKWVHAITTLGGGIEAFRALEQAAKVSPQAHRCVLKALRAVLPDLIDAATLPATAERAIPWLLELLLKKEEQQHVLNALAAKFNEPHHAASIARLFVRFAIQPDPIRDKMLDTLLKHPHTLMAACKSTGSSAYALLLLSVLVDGDTARVERLHGVLCDRLPELTRLLGTKQGESLMQLLSTLSIHGTAPVRENITKLYACI
jgi:hypothetical protein